jgi:hypothetical protein
MLNRDLYLKDPTCQTALKSFQGRASNSFQMTSKVIGLECSFSVA